MFLRGCFLGIFLLLNQLTISSQNDRAILVFHDGSTVEGYGLKCKTGLNLERVTRQGYKYHFRDLKIRFIMTTQKPYMSIKKLKGKRCMRLWR